MSSELVNFGQQECLECRKIHVHTTLCVEEEVTCWRSNFSKSLSYFSQLEEGEQRRRVTETSLKEWRKYQLAALTAAEPYNWGSIFKSNFTVAVLKVENVKVKYFSGHFLVLARGCSEWLRRLRVLTGLWEWALPDWFRSPTFWSFVPSPWSRSGGWWGRWTWETRLRKTLSQEGCQQSLKTMLSRQNHNLKMWQNIF